MGTAPNYAAAGLGLKQDREIPLRAVHRMHKPDGAGALECGYKESDRGAGELAQLAKCLWCKQEDHSL